MSFAASRTPNQTLKPWKVNWQAGKRIHSFLCNRIPYPSIIPQHNRTYGRNVPIGFVLPSHRYPHHAAIWVAPRRHRHAFFECAAAAAATAISGCFTTFAGVHLCLHVTHTHTVGMRAISKLHEKCRFSPKVGWHTTPINQITCLAITFIPPSPDSFLFLTSIRWLKTFNESEHVTEG